MLLHAPALIAITATRKESCLRGFSFSIFAAGLGVTLPGSVQPLRPVWEGGCLCKRFPIGVSRMSYIRTEVFVKRGYSPDAPERVQEARVS